MSTLTLVGTTIGNYRVTDLLGAGGMGSVYLAEHPTIGRKVAIKVLHPHLAVYESDAARFLSEARAAASIDHPNVIDIYDYGQLPDGTPYYIMEMLRGHDLAQAITEAGKMSPEAVLPYLEQMASGLQAAHDRGIIHRDLNPGNIFIHSKRPLCLKILDFGIAKILERPQGGPAITATGVIFGTPLVMAPEQAAGEPHRISPRTDIYSLGVLLYWMMAGAPPFKGATLGLLITQHISEPAPLLSSEVLSVPPGIERLVARCLEKEPSARPVSARAVLEAYQEALAEADPENTIPRGIPSNRYSTLSPSSEPLVPPEGADPEAREDSEPLFVETPEDQAPVGEEEGTLEVKVRGAYWKVLLPLSILLVALAVLYKLWLKPPSPNPPAGGAARVEAGPTHAPDLGVRATAAPDLQAASAVLPAPPTSDEPEAGGPVSSDPVRARPDKGPAARRSPGRPTGSAASKVRPSSPDSGTARPARVGEGTINPFEN